MNTTVVAVLVFLTILALMTMVVLLARKDVLNLGVLVKQITSGRWLLTVTAGLCLIIATVTDAWIAIKCATVNPAVVLPFPVSTIFTLAGVVFTSYFNKKDDVPAEKTDKPENKPL